MNLYNYGNYKNYISNEIWNKIKNLQNLANSCVRIGEKDKGNVLRKEAK